MTTRNSNFERGLQKKLFGNFKAKPNVKNRIASGKQRFVDDLVNSEYYNIYMEIVLSKSELY